MTAYISIGSWESLDGFSHADISVYYTEEDGPPMIDLDYVFAAGMCAEDARTLAEGLIEAADKADAAA
jgi:hypothetical protein